MRQSLINNIYVGGGVFEKVIWLFWKFFVVCVFLAGLGFAGKLAFMFCAAGNFA